MAFVLLYFKPVKYSHGEFAAAVGGVFQVLVEVANVKQSRKRGCEYVSEWKKAI
jgi:hypothetical protein